jgi:23S rRNA (cytosine1962-C5)-methyltransferase
MSKYSKVILKSGKEQSIRRFHPWIFSGAISKINGAVAEGDLVEVYDNKNELLCYGHYQIGSIAVRVVAFWNEIFDENIWINKIQKAFDYRKSVGIIDNCETNVYRLLHGEGDRMPGIIIDFYNGTAVIQAHSIGMAMQIDKISEALKLVYGEKLKVIYNKSTSTLPFKADFKMEDGYIFGKSETEIVEEYGNKFKISWEEGQKTGFFIDQRENRKLLQSYSKDKNVLNVFGYTGGFSVYAMRGGAKLVHSVDSSKKAIDLTDENIELNFGKDKRHQSFAVDAFGFLETIKDKYDVIILDPPAFAKHKNVLDNALKGYKKINAKAIEAIKPGGILFTFSCSQVVTKEDFRKAVFVAAANSGRNVRVLHQLTQPIDHPTDIYHPEGEYLKGLVLFVE